MKDYFVHFLLFLTMITTSTACDTTFELYYLVREPKIKSAQTPVLILLHGVGSNEEDLFSFAEQLPDKYVVISARAPFGLGENRFAWYEVDLSSGTPVFNIQQEEKSRVILTNFISQIKEKYAAQGSEVYLCGFSQGAIMSYSIALTRPDLVQGIAIMSGRLLEEIKPQIADKVQLKKLKVFITHGTDDRVLQINYAREALAYLKGLNINPEYSEYPVGHHISEQMLIDLINWLK